VYRVPVAYNIQIGNSKIKLLTQYESVTQKVLFGNAVLTALISERKYDSDLKMGTVQENEMCVLWFLETANVATELNMEKIALCFCRRTGVRVEGIGRRFYGSCAQLS
jgi:hypothetical protein